MMFDVRADRLAVDGRPVTFVPAHSCGAARMAPELILLHDTAGRLDKGSSVDWFRSPQCGTSAHLVVERDGSVTQMVDLDRVAYHAGVSSWRGRSGCNAFSIGIEIVNPGLLTPATAAPTAGGAGASVARAWFHKRGEGYPLDGLVEKTTPEHGAGWWMPYTDAQIAAVTGICQALIAAYPTITDIGTHWLVSPGRKVDTNPLFPLEEVRAAARHRPVLVRPGLALGARGEEVVRIQERLKALGYPVGTADGTFGPRTRAAVLAFEAENGLDTDGVLGPDEVDALMAAAAKPMPAAVRQAATIADLTAAGSEQMATGAKIKKAGAAVLTLPLADTALEMATGTSAFEVAMRYLVHANKLMAQVGGLGVKVSPRMAMLALAITAGALLWRWGRQIQWRRLWEHRTGQNLGR